MRESDAPIPAPAEAHFVEYWHLLLRRRWVVLACAALGLTVAGILTLSTAPTYRAAATVQIERADPNIMKFQDVMTFDPSYLSYQDYYQTQYKLIASRAVAEKVARTLGLASDQAFMPSRTPNVAARLWSGVTRPLSRARKSPAAASADPVQRAAEAVLGRLKVEPVRNTHLVQISYEAESPEIAARVANGVAEAFISFGMETRVGTSENAGDFLGKQIATLRAEVADLEHAAQKYGESKEIIPTSGQSNTALSALEDLQRAFTAAQAERAEKEAAYTALRAAPDTAVPQVQSSPLIQELTTQVASLEREQAELMGKFKPGWPALAGVSAKLEQARDRLRSQIVAIAGGARQETDTAYRQAVERERNLAALLTQQKRAVLKLSTDSIEYTNLRSEFTKKRETLDQLLKRQSEISLSSHMRDARQSNTRIIDIAQAPRTVYRPNGKMNLFLGLLAGLRPRRGPRIRDRVAGQHRQVSGGADRAHGLRHHRRHPRAPAGRAPGPAQRRGPGSGRSVQWIRTPPRPPLTDRRSLQGPAHGNDARLAGPAAANDPGDLVPAAGRKVSDQPQPCHRPGPDRQARAARGFRPQTAPPS